MEATASLSGIKPVESSTAQNVYSVPLTQVLPLADGSGTAEVVVKTIQVTKQQLQQQISIANVQLANMQKQIADAQAKLDAIIALEAVNVKTPPVTTA